MAKNDVFGPGGSLRLMIAPCDHIMTKEYEAILQGQAPPLAQTLFHSEVQICQISENVPINTARQMKEWFYEHQNELKCLPCLPIALIEPLWEALKHGA